MFYMVGRKKFSWYIHISTPILSRRRMTCPKLTCFNLYLFRFTGWRYLKKPVSAFSLMCDRVMSYKYIREKKRGTQLAQKFKESPEQLKKCASEAMCCVLGRKQAVAKWAKTRNASPPEPVVILALSCLVRNMNDLTWI